MTWKSVADVDVPKWKDDPRYDAPNQRRCKARYVLRGFQDKQIMESEEACEKYRTDSPTGSRLSLHLLFAIAASCGWEVKSCDISTAFLQGVPFGELFDTDERAVQVVPPVEAEEKSNVVWSLRKPVYGIADAPRRWHESLSKECDALGSRTTNLQQAVRKWCHGQKGGVDRADDNGLVPEGVVVEHVDDLVYCGDERFYKEFIEPLKKRFPFGTEDGAYVGFKYTGCIVTQQKGGPVEIEQTKYIRDIKQVPPPTGLKQDDVLEWRFQAAYRSLLGAVAWAGQRTRPDVAYSASRSARFCGKATVQNLYDLNKVARRMFGTSSMKLRFSKLDKKYGKRLMVVSDANWGREKENRSQGGFWLFLAEDQDSTDNEITVVPLAWKSWCLKRVALSTLDAETQAANVAVSHAVFARKFICWFFGISKEQDLPIDLRVDCESLVEALQTTHAMENPRTNVQVQSIRDDLTEGLVRNVKHVSGKVNPADAFTKDHDPVIRDIVHRLMEFGKVKDLK